MIISSQFAARIRRGFFTLGDGFWLPMDPCLRVRPPGIEWKKGRNPNGNKMGKWLPNPIFRHFWAIFSDFGPRAFFFRPDVSSLFGFRPFFHSIPGGWTRKSTLLLASRFGLTRVPFEKHKKSSPQPWHLWKGTKTLRVQRGLASASRHFRIATETVQH